LLAKHVAKNIAKGVGKPTVAFATGAAHIGVYTGVAMLVIGGAFLGVRQHLVGLFGLFELVFSHFGAVTLIAVRVVLHRQFAIRLFDLFLRGVFGNTQSFVIVSFGHVLFAPMNGLIYNTKAALMHTWCPARRVLAGV
jgi:hypothetical protein